MNESRFMVWFDKLLTAGVIGVVTMASSYLSSISKSVQDLNVKIATIIERQIAQEEVNKRQDIALDELRRKISN